MKSDAKLPKPPPERTATPRAMIRDALAEGPATAHDLSTRVRIPERDVASHLEHLAKSLKGHGSKLVVTPAECHACGYVFRDRAKLTTPSACPECRSERVAPPSFQIVPDGKTRDG